MNQKNNRLVSLGMFCAIAYIVMLVGRVPIVMFLSYDPKDVIIVTCVLIVLAMKGII